MTGTVETLDTMLEERYGPIGNERYRTYLSDIRGSGVRIVGLFEDLSSLSKVDGVKQDPAKVPGIDLNEVVQVTVAKMQPEASRVRVLIRTSLSPLVALVAAESDSLRQVVSNLLAGSIRFAGPGGQVIVSTAVGETGKAVLRLRDTGPGLNPQELAELMQPGTPATPAGTTPNADQNLTMAITRAMLEANNATFDVTSKADDGTMIEVLFPPSRA
jgi:signal transduction histidine kinase